MHVDRRLLAWGLFLIAVGAVPLAASQGVIPSGFRWWELWPLLIVGWGIGLLLRRTPAEALGGVLVAVTLGLMLGGLFAAGWNVGIACTGSGTGRPFAAQSGAFSGPNATVALELSCGELAVAVSPGSAWTVEGASRDGQPPRITGSSDGLSVGTRDIGPAFFPFDDQREEWSVTLPTDQSIDLGTTLNAGTARLSLAGAKLGHVSVTVNAGDARVDLSGATVGTLSLTVNAGSGRIVFPASSLTGSITVNAGTAGLCVAPGVGVRIFRNDRTLASDNLATSGLSQLGNAWQTPGFDAAASRIELSTSVNAGSLELNPEGGCQ